MAAKEEVNNTTTETKVEETLDSTTEDAPTSLETIPEGNTVRNGLQTAQKDKTKSIRAFIFPISFDYTYLRVHVIYNVVFTLIRLNFTVDILLKATANAPIMKQKKWSVCQDNPIGRISEFIKKYLKLDPNERLVRDKIYFFLSTR